jgi:hypothetical protein
LEINEPLCGERLFATLACALGGPSGAGDTHPVTPISSAPVDLYFSGVVRELWQFMHRRELTPVAKQTVIRMNRDTSIGGVFDLDAGPVITSRPGKRFLSMQVIDEDEVNFRDPLWRRGPHAAKDQIGTRYVIVAVHIPLILTIRTSRRSMRCRTRSGQPPGGPGSFAIPNRDASTRLRCGRPAQPRSTVPDTKGMFGPRGKVDPCALIDRRSLGGNPERGPLSERDARP